MISSPRFLSSAGTIAMIFSDAGSRAIVGETRNVSIGLALSAAVAAAMPDPRQAALKRKIAEIRARSAP